MTASARASNPNHAAMAAQASTDGASPSKAAVALFTRDGAPNRLILFVSTSVNDRTPVYSGLLNAKRVSAFLRTKAKRPFLSIVDNEIGGTGEQVATGNFIVNASGIPLLAMRMEGSDKTAWVSVGKAISDESLIAMGVDPEKLHVPLAERDAVAA